MIGLLKIIKTMTKTIYINKYEVALFPKDFYISDVYILLEEIKSTVDIFADGNNVVLPIPSDAPREIPRLLLRSKDNSVVCNLSFEKVNIQWVNIKEESNFAIPINRIQETVEKLSEAIFSHSPSQNKMKRIGYIKEIFFLSSDPISDIGNSIFKKELTSNLRTFMFSLTYNLKIKSTDCNKVLTIGDGLKQENGKRKVILVMDDINTKQDKDVNWGTTEINSFINEAESRLDKKDIYSSIFT